MGGIIFAIEKNEFDKIMAQAGPDKSKLYRIISVEYSSLGGGKIYHYELRQSFIPEENIGEILIQRLANIVGKIPNLINS